MKNYLKETSEGLFLYYFVKNETGKSYRWSDSGNHKLSEDFEKSIKKLFSYNFDLLGINEDIEELDSFQEVKTENEQLTKQFEGEEESLFNYSVKPTDNLESREKIALKFAKAFINSDKHQRNLLLENATPSNSEHDNTSLTGFALLLNEFLGCDFNERTKAFNFVRETDDGYERKKVYASELGDTLVKIGYAHYNCVKRGSTLSHILQLREKAIRNLGVEELKNDISKLEESRTLSFDQVEPEEFEELVAYLYASLGYRTQTTSKRGDMGADVIAENQEEKVAIQAKLYKKESAGPSAVRQADSARKNYNCDRAVALTSSKFTDQAKEEAKNQDIDLIGREELVNLIEDEDIDVDKFR